MQQIKFKGNYFTGTKDALHIEDDCVQKMIDAVVNDVINTKDDYYMSYQATGDTVVIGVKFSSDDSITIIVSQDYYEACLYKDDYGNYKPLDWLESKTRGEYEDMTKSELIDRILCLESIRPEYNPRREV